MLMRRITGFAGNWLFEFIQEYTQFLEDYNWYTFHLAQIEFENDEIMGGYEVTVILFGLGFRVRWNHTETETIRELKDTMEGVKAGTVQTRPLSDFKRELFGEQQPMYQLDDGDPHCSCDDGHAKFSDTKEQLNLSAEEKK